MTIEVMYDRVMVRKNGAEAVSTGGIIFAVAPQQTTEEGVVVNAGPGRESKTGITIPMSVNVGDTVIFPFGAGISVNIDGETFTVLNENELLAVKEGE